MRQDNRVRLAVYQWSQPGARRCSVDRCPADDRSQSYVSPPAGGPKVSGRFHRNSTDPICRTFSSSC